MTSHTQSLTPAAPVARTNAVAGIVVARIRQLFQMMKNRRDANMLAGFDDRMLADIGLTRGDVRDAVSEPLWSDPTAILVHRARERRRYRRHVAEDFTGTLIDAPSIVPGHKTVLTIEHTALR
jgi:uncharacterized protein YjiS (DUF1127 family)